MKPHKVDVVAEVKLVEKSNKLHISFACHNCRNKIDFLYDI